MLRLATFAIVLSLGTAAAAPLLCELSCVAPSPAAPSCHDESTGLRLAANASACDHSANDVAVVTAVAKGLRAPISTPPAALPTLEIVVARRVLIHSHGPPGATRSLTLSSSPILRI